MSNFHLLTRTNDLLSISRDRCESVTHCVIGRSSFQSSCITAVHEKWGENFPKHLNY